MAKAERIENVIIILELSDYESRYLKTLMQNPLCDNESEDESNFRETIWKALDKAGVK